MIPQCIQLTDTTNYNASTEYTLCTKKVSQNVFRHIFYKTSRILMKFGKQGPQETVTVTK